ncbi:hypothetical protein B0H13DRAFT_2305387 [Mycena leptocephala]|nr:hypothetical protein B0H13DRAFT_2305387 [Mycena leptocephala]
MSPHVAPRTPGFTSNWPKRLVPSASAASAPVPAAASTSAVPAAAAPPGTSAAGSIVTAPPPYPGTPFPCTTTLPLSAAPPASAVQLPAVALVAPPADSLDGRIERMEALLREMASSKRVHSPTAPDEARAETLTTALAQAPATTAPIVLSPLIAAPVVVVTPASVAPMTTLAPTLGFAAPAPHVAPAPALVHVAPAPAAVAAPPVLGPTPVSVGGATWPCQLGKNIGGESATVIKTVVPAARGVMRNYRARRGPDPHTVIACFESADIASWFITAFNASRVAPYKTVYASPNV